MLLYAQEMPQPREHELECGRAVVFSTKSPSKSSPNEDALGVIPLEGGGCVLAVADGVGGRPNRVRRIGADLDQMIEAMP